MRPGGSRSTIALPGFSFDVERSELRRASGEGVKLRAQCLAVLRCVALRPARLVPIGSPVPYREMGKLHDLVGFPGVWEFEKRYVETA